MRDGGVKEGGREGGFPGWLGRFLLPCAVLCVAVACVPVCEDLIVLFRFESPVPSPLTPGSGFWDLPTGTWFVLLASGN